MLKFWSLEDFNGKSIIFIIHVIYSFFIVQNHREALMFMLIIKLSNHHLILNKFWINIHNILLNMQSNCLIFEFNRCSHFDAFKTFMFSSKNLFDFYFSSNLIFIEFIDLFDRFISFTQDLNQFKKFPLTKMLNFRLNNSFFSFFNVVTKRSILFKSLNKSKISMNIVMIDVVVFYKLNF